MTRENEVFAGFLIGLWVGVIGVLLILNFVDSSISRYNKAIAECEKSLPRDQHCVVIGVPEVKK